MQAILTTNQIRLTSETPLKSSNQNVNIKNEAQESIQQEIKEQAAEREAQTIQCHLFLDQPRNCSEFVNALEKCKPTTTPGPDGIDDAMINSPTNTNCSY